MNLVDSCGWLEYLTGGENADFYAASLNNPDQLIVPSICILEVFKKVLHEKGEDFALQVLSLMNNGKVVDMDINVAVHAAKFGEKLHLSLADSVILATAVLNKAVIWTQDKHFKDIKGVKLPAV